MILGHAHPQVNRAVAEALELGSSFGAPTLREVEIAEDVAAAVPSIEKVRFVSEFTSNQAELERAVKSQVVLPEGAMHSVYDVDVVLM